MGYPYRNRNLNGIDDELNPFDPFGYEEYADTGYEAMDAGSLPDAEIDSGSSWSFSDLLKTGESIFKDVLAYKAATLPNGQRIYTTAVPQYQYGGRAMTVGAPQGVMQFVQNNLPLLAIAGIGILLLTTEDKKK